MMKIKDLFDLSKELINQLDYMVDTYEEEKHVSDDIPSQTLDDIIEEIKEDPVDPEPEPEPEPNTDDTDDTDTDQEEVVADEDPVDPEPEPEPEEDEPNKELIEKINLVIVQLNTAKNNAILDNILDCNCTDISNPKVVSTCSSITNILHQLYDAIAEFRVIYNSDTNANNRAKFIIDSFMALVNFTNLVIKIKSALDSKSYLITVNGPVAKDYDHWVNVEYTNYLTSLDVWRYLEDDTTYLNLIDEAIQLDLKYAALLKKLVISEFKGFDEDYMSLIEFIKNIYHILSYYEANYVKDCDVMDMIYDPTILAKASAITTVIRVSIPVDDEENA